MNEADLMAFIKWLPTKIKEFQNKSPEEITEALNILSKTEEGQIQLRALVEEFKQSSETSLFKKGGKLNYLIEKFQKGGKKTIDTPNGIIYSDGEGEYKDIDGKDAGYKQGALKEWAAQRAADKFAEQHFRSDSTYHALPGGPIYTRSTFYPYSIDTIVSKDGKVYTNSLGRSIRKFVTGTSPFDQINRAIDSIAGYTTKRYQDGGKTNKNSKFNILGTIGDGEDWQFAGEFTYPDGSVKQEIYPKVNSKGLTYLGLPEFKMYISPDKKDTVYVDKIGRIKSGNIEDNLSFLGLNINKVPYLPWNKDKKIQQVEERKKQL